MSSNVLCQWKIKNGGKAETEKNAIKRRVRGRRVGRWVKRKEGKGESSDIQGAEQDSADDSHATRGYRHLQTQAFFAMRICDDKAQIIIIINNNNKSVIKARAWLDVNWLWFFFNYEFNERKYSSNKLHPRVENLLKLIVDLWSFYLFCFVFIFLSNKK